MQETLEEEQALQLSTAKLQGLGFQDPLPELKDQAYLMIWQGVGKYGGEN